MSICKWCRAILTYSYGNVNGDTVTRDIWQVDGEYLCRECVLLIIEQTHHKIKTGRKHIKITYELDRPTHPRGKIINRREEEDC